MFSSKETLEGGAGNDMQPCDSDYGLRYATFNSENPNTLTFPMIVVED
jgi:hypothetical protein